MSTESTTASALPTPERLKPATVTPVFLLLLLETLRDHDRPPEILEDEDVSSSMPRRLGLNEVVMRQIRRLQDATRRREPQSRDEAENLIRLVIRRPDSEEIFEEAGRQMARRAWLERSPVLRRVLPWFPRALVNRIAARAAERLFRHILGGGRLGLAGWPGELSITGSLTASADPGGEACGFYAGVYAELLSLYTSRVHSVRQTRCSARGADACVWSASVIA
jgi:predicted hydrocarbon binding protein